MNSAIVKLQEEEIKQFWLLVVCFVLERLTHMYVLVVTIAVVVVTRHERGVTRLLMISIA